jgi:excisionase family DNA binding protein
MQGLPTFLPTADESKSVIPIAVALHSPWDKNMREPVLLLPDGRKQAIPTALLGVLALSAQAMMNGYAVSVTVHNRMLTTRQAADILACSRQHVVKLIDEGKLKAEKVPGGTHRRVHLRDLLDFMNREDVQRNQLMNEMVSVAEDIGGYDELYEWIDRRKSK